jgi:hypothetical protein
MSDENKQSLHFNESKKYICPMHPEVQSDKEGNCPKCGMRLVPLGRKGEDEEKGTLNKMTRYPWVVLAIIAAFAVVVFLSGKGNFSGFLPLVIILLVCPIAMMFMMRGKGH